MNLVRSYYRNRPIKTTNQYNNEQEQKKKNGCYCRTTMTGLALIIALSVGAVKCHHDVVQDNKEYRLIIDEQRRLLDSLKYTQ